MFVLMIMIMIVMSLVATRLYDLVKIKDRSHKPSHKLDGIGVGRIRTFPFSSDSAYDSVAYNPVKTRLSESEAEAEEPTHCFGLKETASSREKKDTRWRC